MGFDSKAEGPYVGGFGFVQKLRSLLRAEDTYECAGFHEFVLGFNAYTGEREL